MPPPTDGASFDLVAEPWLPVRGTDGTGGELSLEQVFSRAGVLSRLVGDVPTQEFALMRLLLAIAHDALDGPQDAEAWEELWAGEEPFAPVAGYLQAHRERFDLLHPRTPFFQVAGLRTAKDDVAPLNRIVADVPNGDPFFTMRARGAERLDFAEAARWVVHAHAFDPSGIKSGAVGDPRVKSGKGYPQGVAWAGNIGAVLVEGATLRETLLLNLMAADAGSIRAYAGDRPAWRRGPEGPGPAADLASRPQGLRDLYTWQSRRIRLCHDARGVHGVVLGYGDPLAPQNLHGIEPMTGWRRSAAQEKKRGEDLVYMPRTHDPARSAWRGLGALVAGRVRGGDQRRDAAASLRPRVLEWIARLTTEGYLPPEHLIRARLLGAVYGTQQSVVDEMIDDALVMAVVVLHERDERFAQAALEAADDADAAVRLLGELAAELAEASGRAADPERDSAHDLGYGALDGPYRRWLRELVPTCDPQGARRDWQRLTHRIIREAGDRILDGCAGDAAWSGRTVATASGALWLNDTRAELRFRRELSRRLGQGGPGEVPAGTDDDVKVSI